MFFTRMPGVLLCNVCIIRIAIEIIIVQKHAT